MDSSSAPSLRLGQDIGPPAVDGIILRGMPHCVCRVFSRLFIFSFSFSRIWIFFSSKEAFCSPDFHFTQRKVFERGRPRHHRQSNVHKYQRRYSILAGIDKYHLSIPFFHIIPTSDFLCSILYIVQCPFGILTWHLWLAHSFWLMKSDALLYLI